MIEGHYLNLANSLLLNRYVKDIFLDLKFEI